jgi:hypothetical protein
MDKLLHKFVTPEGQEGFGLYTASILDHFTSLVGSMSNISIIACGLAVIALLKLCVLEPWSYTSMLCLVNIDFGVGTVERMYTDLPLVNPTHSMIS